MGVGGFSHLRQAQIDALGEQHVQKADAVLARCAGAQVGEGVGEAGCLVHFQQDVGEPTLRLTSSAVGDVRTRLCALPPGFPGRYDGQSGADDEHQPKGGDGLRKCFQTDCLRRLPAPTSATAMSLGVQAQSLPSVILRAVLRASDRSSMEPSRVFRRLAISSHVRGRRVLDRDGRPSNSEAAPGMTSKKAT